MIPRRIAMRNFMCYAEDVVDLSGVDVACVSGGNGAGKSAILDAITWALWGGARAKRDDELVRLGADDMAVSLDLEVEGGAYRVTRTRRFGKDSSLTLSTPDDQGGWRPLTDGAVRATQAEIDSILRLDLETFVNSAFLRQGKAGEFTTRTPAERKRVLASILGLDRWAGREAVAKERLVEVAGKRTAAAAVFSEAEKAVLEEETVKLALDDAGKQVDELTKIVGEKKKALEEVRGREAELQAVRKEIEGRSAALRGSKDALNRQSEAVRRLNGRLEEAQAVVAGAEDVEAKHSEYEAAKARAADLSAKQSEWREWDVKRNEAEERLKRAEQVLLLERQGLATRIGLHDAKAVEDLRETITSQTEEVERLTALEEELKRLVEEIDGEDGLEQRSRRNLDAVKAKGDEIARFRQQIEELAETDGADCPVCARPIGPDLTAELVREAEEAVRCIQEELGPLRHADKEIAEAREEAEDRRGALLMRLSELKQVERLREVNLKNLDAAMQKQVEVDAAAERVAEIDRMLEDGTFADEPKRAVEEYEAELERIGFDYEAHLEALEAVRNLELYVAKKAEVARAKNDVETLGSEVAEAEAERETLSAEFQKHADALAKLEETESKFEAVDSRQFAVELEIAENGLARASQDVGAAEEALKRVEAAKKTAHEREHEIADLDALKNRWERLRDACGVKGVPAMLIEAAVPEIEAEANELLSRMTRGRMRVRLDTQKTIQTGDVRETLDIRIFDELGVRAYEAFSGGEQFRIDFAVRVALAKVLARRAGAHVGTLIVDEGFGSQDGVGRDRIVEAINAAREDFGLVLVVTHVEEVRDAFPRRIEVTKTPSGSIARTV